MKDFNIKREDIFITSKIAPWMGGTENATKCLEESLSNLDLGYIDLMLIHWPGAQGADEVDILER